MGIPSSLLSDWQYGTRTNYLHTHSTRKEKKGPKIGEWMDKQPQKKADLEV